MGARHGVHRPLSPPFTSTYTAVSMLAQAMADAATDDPTAIRKVATARQFQTPIGPVSIDVRTQHAALRPHMASSNREGEFVLFQSAGAPIEADPYLVRANARMHRRIAAEEPDADSKTALRVIK